MAESVSGMTDEELVRLWVRTKPGDSLRVALAVPEQRRMAMAVGKYREWLPGDAPSEGHEAIAKRDADANYAALKEAYRRLDAVEARLEVLGGTAKPVEKPPVQRCGNCEHWCNVDEPTCGLVGGPAYRCRTTETGTCACWSVRKPKPVEKPQDIEKTCGSCRHWDNGCSSRGGKACSAWSERETIKKPEPATNPVIPKTLEFDITKDCDIFDLNGSTQIVPLASAARRFGPYAAVKYVRLVVEVE